MLTIPQARGLPIFFSRCTPSENMLYLPKERNK